VLVFIEFGDYLSELKIVKQVLDLVHPVFDFVQLRVVFALELSGHITHLTEPTTHLTDLTFYRFQFIGHLTVIFVSKMEEPYKDNATSTRQRGFANVSWIDPPRSDVITDLCLRMENLKHQIWCTDVGPQYAKYEFPIPTHSPLQSTIDLHTDREVMEPLFQKIKSVAHLVNDYMQWFMLRMMFLEYEGEDTMTNFMTKELPNSQAGRSIYLKHFRYTYLCLSVFEKMAKHKIAFQFEVVEQFCGWILNQPYFHERPEIVLVTMKVLNRLPDRRDRVPVSIGGDNMYEWLSAVLKDEYHKKHDEIGLSELFANMIGYQHDYPYEFMTFEALDGIRYFTPLVLLLKQAVYYCSQYGGGLEWVVGKFIPDLKVFTRYPSYAKKRMIDAFNTILTRYYMEDIVWECLSAKRWWLCLSILSDFGKEPWCFETHLRFVYLACLIAGGNEERWCLFEAFLKHGVFHMMLNIWSGALLGHRMITDIAQIAQLIATVPDADGRYFNIIAQGEFVSYFYKNDFNNLFKTFVAKLLGRDPTEQSIEQYRQRLLFVLFGYTVPAGTLIEVRQLQDTFKQKLSDTLYKMFLLSEDDGFELLYTIRQLCLEYPDIHGIVQQVNVDDWYESIEEDKLDERRRAMLDEFMKMVVPE
jgi:hypothetical protein